MAATQMRTTASLAINPLTEFCLILKKNSKTVK